MNYTNTSIQVAPDTSATEATMPAVKAGKKSIAVVEYELLAESPYTYTQEEVQFAVHCQRQGISDHESNVHRHELWEEYFSRSRACMRTSPLAKTYGWGLHFDPAGKVALVPVESAEYKRLACDSSIAQTYAM